MRLGDTHQKAPSYIFRYPAAASQAPQSAHGEDYGEERGHAERDERPHEEERSAGVGDPAAGKSCPPHVDDGDARRKERRDEDDDVSRTPSGEHQRSVKPDEQEEHRNEVRELARGEPADDVIRMVK